MKIENALAQIFSEVERAEKLHPDWPTNLENQGICIGNGGERRISVFL